MAHRRSDVVAKALEVLDDHGLADLSMRRLAAELDVRPSALYWHFANKQELLAAVSDEILARGLDRREHSASDWNERIAATCRELRDAMLAFPDGAELVATIHAFGLGTVSLDDRLGQALSGADLGDDLRHIAASTLLHFVFGHVADEQTHLQADSAGALVGRSDVDTARFEAGLALIIAGIAQKVAERAPS